MNFFEKPEGRNISNEDWESYLFCRISAMCGRPVGIKLFEAHNRVEEALKVRPRIFKKDFKNKR